MIVQTIDDKKDCVGYFSSGEMFFDDSFLSERQEKKIYTWKYSDAIRKHDAEYLYLYTEGKNLESLCPEKYKKEYESIKRQLHSIKKSYTTSKININQYCIYDVIPEWLLKEYLSLREKIIKHILNNYERPKNYFFLKDLYEMLEEIKGRKLNINLNNINKKDKEKMRVRQFVRRIQNSSNNIAYELFGAKTGGLRTKKGYFNIMNLDRCLRGVLEPNNALEKERKIFVELDYNSAHLRVFLGLCGIKQPKKDIHEWNRQFFKDGKNLAREEIKKRIFKFLYSDDKDKTLTKIYDKEKIFKKYWKKNGKIINEYKREIECDKFKALNYLISSTFNDLFLRKSIEINKFLKGKKSCIVGLISDSILLEISENECDLIKKIAEKFSQTNFGDFKINVKFGKNYGDMRKVDLCQK